MRVLSFLVQITGIPSTVHTSEFSQVYVAFFDADDNNSFKL